MSQSSDETRTNIGWGYAKDEQQFGKDLRKPPYFRPVLPFVISFVCTYLCLNGIAGDHPAFNSTTLPRSLTFSFTTDKTHLEIVPDPSGSFIREFALLYLRYKRLATKAEMFPETTSYEDLLRSQVAKKV